MTLAVPGNVRVVLTDAMPFGSEVQRQTEEHRMNPTQGKI